MSQIGREGDRGYRYCERVEMDRREARGREDGETERQTGIAVDETVCVIIHVSFGSPMCTCYLR